jgi:serine/threonine protein kinase
MLGRFGGYEISGVIGCGGMGVVLKGFDAALSRYVAIKVLAPHLAASGSARRRFAREAQAAAAVVHENVVAIHGVAEASNLPYFVMPYVRGTSLDKRLDEHGLLGVAEVLRIALQTAAGLAAAHAQGLVHRDIKPANILLADGVERVKITDFGLARAVDDASLTRTGVIAGTPQFMSPEQARGESVDARSDLFSLGSVMYAMCTGRPPFRAETSYGILRRITDSEPRPIREINAEIPEWLVAIISKLHGKDPAERFQSADQVAKLLEQCLAHVQQPTVVPLPDAAQLLVKQACQPARVGWWASPGRLGQLGKTILRPRFLLAGAIVVSMLAVVAVVSIALRTHSGDDSGRTANSPPPAAVSAPEPSHSTSDFDSTSSAWQDGSADQILELEHDIQGLEASAARLWGDGASSSISNTSTNANRPFDVEPSK